MFSNTPQRTPLAVWWIVWAGVLGGLVVLYLVLGRGPLPPVKRQDLIVNLVGFVPLFVSIIVRWLVLPRFGDLTRAFPMFIVGLALAEGCGILGIFLGGPYRDALALLSLLGLLQFAPFFARQLAEPKPKGFIPNN
jgi:hypothetical protein